MEGVYSTIQAKRPTYKNIEEGFQTPPNFKHHTITIPATFASTQPEAPLFCSLSMSKVKTYGLSSKCARKMLLYWAKIKIFLTNQVLKA